MYLHKVIFGGLLLLLLYLGIASTSLKTWFALVLGFVVLFAILRMDVQDWWRGASSLKIEPALQFALAAILLVATAVATDWTEPGRRDLTQAVYAFWTLVLYREGFRWAYRRLMELRVKEPW
jgi:hypothetical protein